MGRRTCSTDKHRIPYLTIGSFVGAVRLFKYKYIYTSFKCPQSMKKFKGQFSGPSDPSHQTRPSASLCRCSHWTPEGHCGCLVDFLSTTPNSIIFKITTGTCVLKTNFYTHKKKSPVPALILKFLTTTPNLTSNFET